MNGLPGLRLLPDAPVPDGRTVLTDPDATSVEAVNGSRAASTAFHTGYEPARTITRRTKVIGRFPRETSCLTLVRAVLDRYITHATNGIKFTQIERQRLKRLR